MMVLYRRRWTPRLFSLKSLFYSCASSYTQWLHRCRSPNLHSTMASSQTASTLVSGYRSVREPGVYLYFAPVYALGITSVATDRLLDPYSNHHEQCPQRLTLQSPGGYYRNPCIVWKR
ncbi:hypothetical protein FKP32DRAFT_1294703 [Trametes sanguinea]|nr:hypothetical protein FKP32DRAFT_1294703 [Trametes sanguinea]